MCIIILNHKKEKEINKKHLENSFKNNPDGAGIIWVEGKELKVFKTFNMNAWIKKYQKIKKRCNSHIVLHSRIATSGLINKKNIHPFLISKKVGFVHNGMIEGLGGNKFSDTYAFNEILKGLPSNFYKNLSLLEMIRGYIGYSKIVFLDNKNNFVIINDTFGHKKGLNWFSNETYKYNNDYKEISNNKINYKPYKKNYWDDSSDGDYFSDECRICGKKLLENEGCYCNDCINW